MGSDVMIVCKEFDNWIHNREDLDTYKPIEHALCIGEASMGDVGENNQFAIWFQERYFCGEDMMQQLMNQQIGYDRQKRTEFNFQKGVFTEIDYNACVEAIKTMSSDYLRTEEQKQEVLYYLKKCIGKHISTENW